MEATSVFKSLPDSTTYDYRMSLEKLKSELSKFGLTSNQSKVYIYLGKHGHKTALEVCKALKLPRTETYYLLTTLQNKGIVSATFHHPIRFSALPLDKVTAMWTDFASMIYLMKLLFNYVWTTSKGILPTSTHDLIE